MNIYALRDKLIDYYLQPFAAPNDPQVLAAIARSVNTGELSDLAQAPHHFEIWKIGSVNEDGTLTPCKELIAECSSLVRDGIRDRGKPGSQPIAATTGQGQGRVPRNGEYYRTNKRSPEDQVEAEVSPAAEVRPGSGRLD